MSGFNHQRMLLRITEAEMNDLRRENNERLTEASFPKYYCVTKGNAIHLWPPSRADQLHWHLSFEDKK
jgi:hypothetical protein